MLGSTMNLPSQISTYTDHVTCGCLSVVFLGRWGRVSSRLGLDLLDFLDVPDLLDSLDVLDLLDLLDLPWIYCIYRGFYRIYWMDQIYCIYRKKRLTTRPMTSFSAADSFRMDPSSWNSSLRRSMGVNAARYDQSILRPASSGSSSF